jgi:hypothetical protein
MISRKGKGKTSYTQDIGETDVGPRRNRERLLQRIQMDEPMPGAPAIPLEILWNHLKQYCFSERNIRMLQRCDVKSFPDHNSNLTKFFIFINFALRELGIKISIGSLKRAFDCPRTAAVNNALRNGREPPKQCDHHNSLLNDSEREADILAWIQRQAESPNHLPSTRTDILHYCASKFGKVITRG